MNTNTNKEVKTTLKLRELDPSTGTINLKEKIQVETQYRSRLKNPPTVKPEVNKGKSFSQPNMALTPRQIIEMSKRGITTPSVSGSYQYEGDPNDVLIDMSMKSFNYMSPIEKIEHAREQVQKYEIRKQQTENLIKQIDAEQAAIKKAQEEALKPIVDPQKP